MTRILLADDHQLVRQGLRSLLERDGFEIVGEASNGREAVDLAKTLRPDVAVLDLAMPVMNGIDAARAIAAASSRTQCIVLTMYEESRYVLEALQAGVRGYLLKSRAAADLVQAIREVAGGATYLSPGISETVVQAYLHKTGPTDDVLTSRERQVLQLIAEGKSTKEAASVLGMSVKTAESHRTHLMKKLGIHETASLVRYAIRRGLVQA
ncbi:MAG: response regulator transcription factor [Myxococcales bacterium]|nr:response regulator transcription factor [Myxococcales bacterium]